MTPTARKEDTMTTHEHHIKPMTFEELMALDERDPRRIVAEKSRQWGHSIPAWPDTLTEPR